LKGENKMDSKWQGRIEKRRNDPYGSVVAYVDGIVRNNHVALEEVAQVLTPNELQEIKDIQMKRAKEKAESEARMEADRLERERKYQQNQARLGAFWENNPPPSFLTAVPDIQSENDLFDILARYHIAKVEYCFDHVDYHWDQFLGICDGVISAWLPLDIEISLEDGLPGDDDGEIGETIRKAITEFGKDGARGAPGKLIDGKVVFNVSARLISVEVTSEVTREELYEDSWKVGPEELKANA
jgi:hypothetical protein